MPPVYRGGHYLVVCVGVEPDTRPYRKIVSAHRLLPRAIDAAVKGCQTTDPPTDDAIALLRANFDVVVLGRWRSRTPFPSGYDWAVVDDRTGTTIHAVWMDERGEHSVTLHKGRPQAGLCA